MTMTRLLPPLYKHDWELPSAKAVRQEEEILNEKKEEEEEKKRKEKNKIPEWWPEKLKKTEQEKREKEDKEEEEKRKKRKKEEQEKREKEEKEEEEEIKKDIAMSVPSSLRRRIYPILRTAKVIEKSNHRVAYLCRFAAYLVANMDDGSSETDIHEFKASLLYKLEQDEKKTSRRLQATDTQEIQSFCEQYCKKNFSHGLESEYKVKMSRLRMIASVLYDVIKFLTPEEYHLEFDEYLKGFEEKKKPDRKVDVEEEKVSIADYNILPLGTSEPVMEIPEIKAATELILCKCNLPKPRTHKMDGPDMFDWLWHTFGFQKSNVLNQKEHLILLLANIDMRKRGERHNETHNLEIHNDTVTYLTNKIFHNYISWCRYLHLESNIKIPRGASTQLPELLYIGLFLLIWGEASNVRFMPECLCYIFHHMAKYLFEIISCKSEDSFDPPFGPEGKNDAFLHVVIQPIFNIMHKEATMSKHGRMSHSKWRNYDDLNEYFWSKKCFKQLKWPMDLTADFFMDHMKSKNETEKLVHVVTKLRILKTNFVELRTFFLLFNTFDRMWAFFILAFQVMVIISWSPSGRLASILEPSVFRKVLTIFITDAFLNFVQATLDIILFWKAWRSLECTQMIRYVLKFVMAIAWLIILPTTYINSVLNDIVLVKIMRNWFGDFQSGSIYNYAVTVYMLPTILSAFFFIFLPFRRKVEYSNSRIVRAFLWWSQPKLYIAQGMYHDTTSFLRYMFFWSILLICKLAFSFYVEAGCSKQLRSMFHVWLLLLPRMVICLLVLFFSSVFEYWISPLVAPTRDIIFSRWESYEHGSFLYLQQKFGVLITVWAPVTMVYFLDTQIWYSIFSTLCGGMSGLFSRLGEINTMSMLRSRFKEITRAYGKNLVPRHSSQSKMSEHDVLVGKTNHCHEFSDSWNEFIISLREEDLVNHRERELLSFPSFMTMGDTTVFQWPPFLLVGKIHCAIDMARISKDDEFIKKIKQDPYTYDAVIECYETMSNIVYSLMSEPRNRKVVDRIRDAIDDIIRHQSFLKELYFDELPTLIHKFGKMLSLLKDYDMANKKLVLELLEDIMDFITTDVMKNGQSILKDVNIEDINFDDIKSRAWRGSNYSILRHVSIEDINFDAIKGRAWREKCIRLELLMTMIRESAYVPRNKEAQRRILFFTNSLFMQIPGAPQVHNMMSFSVLTPCFKKEVLFSADDLLKFSEHGISLLTYLRNMYHDEFGNFLERIDFTPRDEDELLERLNEVHQKKERINEISLWASCRGQTVFRTVRGIMYYRRALEIQCIQDKANLDKFDSDKILESTREARATAEIKFTYVVSYQINDIQKNSNDIRDLMKRYPSLRVAYIDEVEDPLTCNGTREKTYYSVLVKGAGQKKYEEVYRIKLPGNPTYIGAEKPETQNHAIIFTRGEALQTIDMNQDHYLEEAFKMRNLLQEFESEMHGKSKPTILGVREHHFTQGISSLSSFISNQESSFATIGQRVMANALKVRFHYGHSDIFDRLFHITRGGISKASKNLNESEGIFAGFNSIMRGGIITHHEYTQVGKGLDVLGINQISSFEANVASDNGEQTLSRDIYRLGQRFDFYRMLSLYFTTVGFYFNSLVSVLTIYVFLYGRLYLVMIGLEKYQHIQENIKTLESELASQSVFQLGFLFVLPVLMEFALETGFLKALREYVIMQFHLLPVFFTLQLGTRTHYYGRRILHGRSTLKHEGHGRHVPYHVMFAENYRMYSRSHFVKGLELLVLVAVYQIYGCSYHSSSLYRFITISIWFLVASWLFAPFLFNPSCFEWHRVVEDWSDWRLWLEYQGGFAMSVDQSWEAWWETEQKYLRHTSIQARLLELILSLRFLMYHCVILYYTNIARPIQSTMVYLLSWLILLSILVVRKVDSISQQRFGWNLQLMLCILKALVFLGSVLMMSVLFIVANLTVSDIFYNIIGLIPAGWYIVLIGQACHPFLKKKTMVWDTIRDIARAYDSMIGVIIFFSIAVLSWFPYISELQTRVVFIMQAFGWRHLQVSEIFGGRKDVVSKIFGGRKDNIVY